MATYKVPQDVEADDKLLGPFSFRQFVYLIIVVMAGLLAWWLGTIFIGLAVIPLPVIFLFGALALPLRKDQPMEVYLAALVSFYLKPRRRLWDPEGVEQMIEITAPKTLEVSRVKDLSEGEAQERLSYLASLVDSRGWSIRGVDGVQGTTMNTDVYLEAQGATDVLDTTNQVAQNFGQMMAQSTQEAHDRARARMMQPQPVAAPPAPQAYAPAPQPPMPQAYQQPPQQEQAAYDPIAFAAEQVKKISEAAPAVNPVMQMQSYAQADGAVMPLAPPPVIPDFNPYPEFNQSVIQPLNAEDHAAVDPDTLPKQAPSPAPASAPQPEAPKEEDSSLSTSDTELTAGIMNLANNPDLSIETIAHQADRLAKKAKEKQETKKAAPDEVVISLR